MKKISIIGANSYIARNLIYKINSLSQDYQLKLYDYQEYHLDNIKNYQQMDINDTKSIKEYVDLNCDVIFMFVGKTGTKGFDDYNSYIDINEKGLLNILKVYNEVHSNAKIIFPSTRLVYKGSETKLNENSEKEFKSLYAINKYSCEQYLKMYNNIYDINYIILRICVPYSSLIENISSYGTYEFFLSKAKKGEDIILYGDGNLKRTFIHIDDLCNIILLAAFNKDCINDVYNIGGEDYSLKDVAKIISRKYKCNIKHIDWPKEALLLESGSTVFDSSKLDNILKYKIKHFLNK